ncbi:DUF3048 domain-containing protein [Lachnospira multipara]|uniref:DUF3048 domain-containing protein n=1 Tax=Lachnospira multipara TaxID=28051 RepID=A0A1H5VZY4_9FIRM|nr:DUF3048 domain-containing protein [Lachnospira multipara]SEF92780.1 Protein of unknown function [Lachnospira multipara]
MKVKRLLSLLLVCLFSSMMILNLGACGKKKAQEAETETKTETEETTQEQTEAPEVVDVVDVNSKTRPFAISINNVYPATTVQRGLNKAFLIYEIPVEGGQTRLLAFFKDVEEDLQVGTVRSARHNMLDYCFESDAIFVHFGGSDWAISQISSTGIDDINGMYDSPFWRENPKNLATEHTAYTSTLKLLEYARDTKGFNMEADSAEDTLVFNYNVSDVELSGVEGALPATNVKVTIGGAQTTTFSYDQTTKEYTRANNGTTASDYGTGENFTAKNIIVQNISYGYMSDNYCLDIYTTGSGTGYYITNGSAIPINWSKADRYAQTVYTNAATGEEIELSDGRTYVELHPTSEGLTIE